AARAVAVGPGDDLRIAAARRLALRRGNDRAARDLGMHVAGDLESCRQLVKGLAPLVAGADEDPRVPRVDVRHEPGELPPGDVEVRRDAEGVVRAAVERKSVV